MAVTSTAVEVTDEPTDLNVSGGSFFIEVLIQNLGSAPVFVGGANVTVETGIKIDAGATLGLNSVRVAEGDLFAVAASGTHDVRVLEAS